MSIIANYLSQSNLMDIYEATTSCTPHEVVIITRLLPLVIKKVEFIPDTQERPDNGLDRVIWGHGYDFIYFRLDGIPQGKYFKEMFVRFAGAAPRRSVTEAEMMAAITGSLIPVIFYWYEGVEEEYKKGNPLSPDS